MAVHAIKDYSVPPRDLMSNFHGKQIVYVSWDRHLLFAAAFLICVPTETPFKEFVEGPLSALLQLDPDAASIDWTTVEWLKSNEPFAPDFAKSLADNGIRHKDQLRIRTPGLNSLFPEG